MNLKTTQNMQVSHFKGFSKPEGNISLLEKLTDIAKGKQAKNIKKLRTLLCQGKEEEAAHVKRQLPSFTLSATYTGKRREEGITGYNDILMLDFDKLSEEELLKCREVIVGIPHTLFCFRSPSNNGLKAGVYYRSPEIDTLRERLFAKAEINTTELQAYHKQAFEHCRLHYETHCGVSIDTSGSDIGRLCFVSHDPEIYINRPAIKALTPPQLTITAPPATPGKEQKIRPQEILQEELPGNALIDCSHINPHIQLEFQKCVNKAQRTMTYQPGQRDSYIYALGHLTYTKGIPQEHATLLTQHRYGGHPDIDIPKIIANAYLYTHQTDRKKEEKQKLVAVKVLEFLGNACQARRNVILESMEIRMKAGNPAEPDFQPIRTNDYNTLYLDAQEAGISCQPHIIRTVINSRFAHDFNPFEDYFGQLPPWDKKIDYIDRLAETVQTNHQDFWRDCFKRWIVGMVACALDDDRENQLALIIKGDQGKGKSRWVRRLLPDLLKHYYRNGMINPSNKDHMLCLSQRLIINLEEFEGMRKEDLADLKRLITQDTITERKAYAEEAGYYIRRASFIATTNESRFLEDLTGTRRFPTFTAIEVDYITPVDHAHVYAQAMHLWKNGFKYWYDKDELHALNAHNAQYTISSQEQELFYTFYRKPLKNDYSIKWMAASAILTYLSIFGKIQATKQSQRNLIKVLEQDDFCKRVSENQITEYKVVCIHEAK